MTYYNIIQAFLAMSPAPEGAPDTEGHAMVMLIFYIGLFGIFYFLLIRPQMKRNKETRSMRETLQKGDNVVTTGGIYGLIHKIKDDVVILEVAEGVRIKVQKHGITEQVKTPDKTGDTK